MLFKAIEFEVTYCQCNRKLLHFNRHLLNCSIEGNGRTSKRVSELINELVEGRSLKVGKRVYRGAKLMCKQLVLLERWQLAYECCVCDAKKFGLYFSGTEETLVDFKQGSLTIGYIFKTNQTVLQRQIFKERTSKEGAMVLMRNTLNKGKELYTRSQAIGSDTFKEKIL